MISRKHDETLRQGLQKKMGLKSVMAVPRLQKIVLNMGVGEAVNDKKAIEYALADMTAIAGQKPVVTKSKISEAGFKIREGWPIGCRVTLRRNAMYQFLERFIAITCPRIRDFRGFTVRSLDGRGNMSFGIKEQIVFNEIRYEQIDKIRGLDIAFVTDARDYRKGLELLMALGFPFYDAERLIPGVGEKDNG